MVVEACSLHLGKIGRGYFLQSVVPLLTCHCEEESFGVYKSGNKMAGTQKATAAAFESHQPYLSGHESAR